MISRRISEVLVKAAARRWPERLRADVQREWTAEVAVLAEEHRHWRMLRYALSLATHPAPRPATTSTPVLVRAWRAVRLLVVGPVVCAVLLLASAITMNVVVNGPLMQLASRWLPYWAFDLSMRAQLPLLSLLCLGSAWLAAQLSHRWAPVGLGIAPLLLAATVPGFLVVAAVVSIDGPSNAQRLLPLAASFSLGLIVLLYFVARLARSGKTVARDGKTVARSGKTAARSGRRRRAGWLGVIGAFAIADIAVMPAVLSIRLPPEEGAIALSGAPMWLPALLTDTGFGLPHPSPSEVFAITDVLVGVPQMWIVLTGWALGLVLGAVVSDFAADGDPRYTVAIDR